MVTLLIYFESKLPTMNQCRRNFQNPYNLICYCCFVFSIKHHICTDIWTVSYGDKWAEKSFFRNLRRILFAKDGLFGNVGWFMCKRALCALLTGQTFWIWYIGSIWQLYISGRNSCACECKFSVFWDRILNPGVCESVN